jgi:hypothetical protein
MAAEVIKSIRRRKNLVRGDWINIPIPTIFTGAATRSLSSTNPSPCRYPFIDRLPQAVCLGLLQRHMARIGGPITTKPTWGGYGRLHRD